MPINDFRDANNGHQWSLFLLLLDTAIATMNDINDMSNSNMNAMNAASSPCVSTEGGGVTGSDCSSVRGRTPPPPKKRLVGRIKPVTSPRTSMKLLALQHLANVYATKQAAAAKGITDITITGKAKASDEQHSVVSSPSPSTSNIPLSPMTLPAPMTMQSCGTNNGDGAMSLPMSRPMAMQPCGTNHGPNMNKNAAQLDDAMAQPIKARGANGNGNMNMNANKGGQLEDALELPFDPQGGAAVRTYVENGPSGTYELFP